MEKLYITTYQLTYLSMTIPTLITTVQKFFLSHDVEVFDSLKIGYVPIKSFSCIISTNCFLISVMGYLD